MKTVVFVWTHKFNIDDERLKKYNYFNETEFYFGLGDLLRATIKLFYLSKTMNFKFIVDVELHPISFFLKCDKHEYSEVLYQNKDNVDYVCYGEVEDYIESKKDGELIFMFTNDFYEGDEISEECKEFMKGILTPTDKYEKYITQLIGKIPFGKYNILHYRLNDSEFLGKESLINFGEKLEHLKKNREPNDVLVTDTLKFKNYVFFNDDIFMFDTKVCHLGLSTNVDEIRETLFEFFLITRSSKIKTYCKIHKISGFVKWISKIYDVPIVSI